MSGKVRAYLKSTSIAQVTEGKRKREKNKVIFLLIQAKIKIYIGIGGRGVRPNLEVRTMRRKMAKEEKSPHYYYTRVIPPI